MPGRDDLIKQNTDRARTNSQAPAPQEKEGKSAESSGMSVPKSFFGGNFEVFSALEKMYFRGVPGEDGSLRGNTAYIRVWKRGGTSQQTSATTPGSEVSDRQAELQDELEAAIDNRDAVAKNFNPVTGTYGEYKPHGNVDNRIETAEAQIQIVEGKIDLERQRSISAQTPTNPTQPPSPNTPTSQTTSTSPTPSTPPVGSVKSANPNGFINTLKNVGRAIVGLPPSPPGYSGGANSKGDGVSSPPGEMMWQFLFNPSELELEVGPEFKNSETWGVSDKANSGQPLHWSHNTNPQLKFNSVLLNGFVFGRKVEALEQGLFELFMARDGVGQDGPHVLEFVWGKRVFGPCVIRNINVKEKMWDEGEVVNAELSFTLEQVPEWTINDGFVDVARPGRLGTIGDPTTPPGTQSQTPPGGGGASPDQKSNGQGGSTPTGLYKKCQKGGRFADAFKKLEGRVRAASTGGAEPPLKQRLFQLRSAAYIPLYNRAKTSLGSEFTSRSTYANVIPDKLIQAMNIAIDFEDNKTGLNALTRNYYNAQSILQNAANSAYNASKAFSQSPQCVAERKKVDKVTDKQEADRVCRNKQPGTKCSYFNVPPGGRIKSCSGVELICGSDGYLKNSSTYRS